MKRSPSISRFSSCPSLAWMKSRAFSVIELLVVAALVAALKILAAPVAQQLRKRSEGIRCQRNLCSVGTVLLISKGYVTPQQLAAMSCPGIPYAAENGSISGRHYGIFFRSPEGKVSNLTEANGNKGEVYLLPIRAHATPAAALFLVDSATSQKAPTIRAFSGKDGQSPASSGGIHLRHSGSANLFFLDGHSEISSAERLRELGAQQVLNEEFEMQTL